VQYNVAILDDHELFVDSIEMLIDSTDNFTVVGKGSCKSCLDGILKDNEVDLIILDIRLGQESGLNIAVDTVKIEGLKTLVVSRIKEPELVVELKQIGVHGYLDKSANKSEFLLAMNTVVKGEEYFPESLLPAEGNRIFSLSDQEIRILKLCSKGLNSSQIGEELFISKYTAETHKRNILKKAGAANISEAIARAISVGIM